MKKIIATVLAMVMALALCVTAFAATTYAGYGPNGKEITKDAKYTYEKVDADYDQTTVMATLLTTGSRPVTIPMVTLSPLMPSPMT